MRPSTAWSERTKRVHHFLCSPNSATLATHPITRLEAARGAKERVLQMRKPSKQSESTRAQVLSLAIQITHKLVDASVSKRNSLLPLDTRSIPHTQMGSPCCACSFFPLVTATNHCERSEKKESKHGTSVKVWRPCFLACFHSHGLVGRGARWIQLSPCSTPI